MNSDWKTRDLRCVWHPFTQMQEYGEEEPLVISHAEGNYLIDVAGKRYLDGVSSLWVNLHGHRHPVMDAAIRDQLDKIAHSTLLGTANQPSIELAEQLIGLAPQGLTKVFYSDNGSTAVEVALKIAFEYWQLRARHDPILLKKKGFLSFHEAYHGDTLGAVSVGHIELFHEVYRPLLFPSFQAPVPTDPNCLSWVEKLFQEKSGEIAACIIEPLMQAAGGMIVQPKGFLKKLEALCRRYQILLIADEVATGFGRTGTLFACEQEGVAPDLLCLAKGLTAGYLPLAATLATEEIYQAFLGDYGEFRHFFHGHSYTGNQLGCAAALANLKIFVQEKVLQKLPEKIALFEKLLGSRGAVTASLQPYVKEVRQKGLMIGIELQNHPIEQRIGHRICLKAREQGVFIRPLGNTIVLMPPLSITLEEIKFLCEVTREAIESLPFVRGG